MKAALCKSLDGPNALVIDDIADPVAAAGEVIVRVRMAALNFADTLITRGRYQEKPALPSHRRPRSRVSSRLLARASPA